MKLAEVKKHENKKGFSDLLKIKKLPPFKYREVEGKLDIFFPSKDIFLFFNIFESFVFKRLFLKDNSEDIASLVQKNFSFGTEKTNKKLNKFLTELYSEVR